MSVIGRYLEFDFLFQVWMLVFTITTSVTGHYWYNVEAPVFSPQSYIYLLIMYLLVAVLLEGKAPSKAEISHMNEEENMHVADGLAWNYYLGYLKLILEEFDDMINTAVHPDYFHNGADYRDLLSSKKLFIVIPKSCFCYDNLKKDFPNITAVGTMPPQRLSRAGIQERDYRNTLYEVKNADEEAKYIMLEWATPVLHMYDMAKNGGLTGFTEEDRDAQVVQFYKTLKELIDKDMKVKDKVELVLLKEPKCDNPQFGMEHTILKCIKQAN